MTASAINPITLAVVKGGLEQIAEDGPHLKRCVFTHDFRGP